MELKFPVLILEKDSGDILKFESVAAMQRYLERIDVESNEYAAWDASGQAASLLVQEPAWLKVVPARKVEGPSLRDSLKRFANSRNVSLTDSEQELAPLDLYEVITSRGGSRGKLRRRFRPHR